MKRIVAIVSALVMSFVLAACAASSLGIETDDSGIHVVAQNGADGSGTGQISIKANEGLCINHIVEKGSFHVTATDKYDNVAFDEDITDNIANFVPVDGDFDVIITAKGATGTIDIIAYDKEAQAQADATLEDALSDAGVDSDVAESITKKSE